MPAKAGIQYEGPASDGAAGEFLLDASFRWHDERDGWSMKAEEYRHPSAGWGPMLRFRNAMRPAVYIICNHRHGTLYTGVTSDLARRVWEHRTGALEGFSKRYGLKVLVWYEPHGTMEEAITREKHIKAWKRDWKVRLIERMNPTWCDLYKDLNG